MTGLDKGALVGSGERFDSMTRLFGGRLSRRQAMKLAVGGALGTAGIVALQQRPASAQCAFGVNCFAPNFCCPATPFGETCAPPGALCCGATACFPPQQCCPSGPSWAPFCAPPPPNFCCGPIACTPAAVCVGPGCCAPLGSPPGTFCCGPLFCSPGQVCVQYPPGTFQCAPPCGGGCPVGTFCEQGACIPIPAPSDRNIKEHVVPVAW